ncbi:MAG: ABC transporter permease [Phycisphaerae bacterium]|nr:ABC transporter permease [Phycisphaerae bacterium]
MLRRILALTIKEFLAIAKDPKSRFVVIGPPLIQFFVYGYAATFDVTDVRYAAFDEDRTSASRALLAQFDGSGHFRRSLTIDHEEEIADAIDNEAARLVVHVPQRFAADLAAGRTAEVQVIVDGRNSNVASIAGSYVNSIVNEFNARYVGGPGVSESTAPSIVLVERAWYNPNLLSRWFIVAALGGVISTVVVMVLSSLSVAREREFGTFDQLLVAPFSPAEILIGKSVPAFVFGLGNALLLSAAAVWWFQIPFEGSILALVLILSTYILSIVGLGLFVSSLSTTMQQGLLGSFIAIFPIVILSGFTTPIENMPDWLQFLTLANPLRYVTAGLRRIFLESAGVSQMGQYILPLLLIAAITLTVAGWFFRHRTQ